MELPRTPEALQGDGTHWQQFWSLLVGLKRLQQNLPQPIPARAQRAQRQDSIPRPGLVGETRPLRDMLQQEIKVLQGDLGLSRRSRALRIWPALVFRKQGVGQFRAPKGGCNTI